MKFTRMRSKLGRRRFTVIEDFTWCERKYLEWFRGYTYSVKRRGHTATIPSRNDMQIRYVDKYEILFKPGNRILSIEEML